MQIRLYYIDGCFRAAACRESAETPLVQLIDALAGRLSESQRLIARYITAMTLIFPAEVYAHDY